MARAFLRHADHVAVILVSIADADLKRLLFIDPRRPVELRQALRLGALLAFAQVGGHSVAHRDLCALLGSHSSLV